MQTVEHVRLPREETEVLSPFPDNLPCISLSEWLPITKVSFAIAIIYNKPVSIFLSSVSYSSKLIEFKVGIVGSQGITNRSKEHMQISICNWFLNVEKRIVGLSS